MFLIPFGLARSGGGGGGGGGGGLLLDGLSNVACAYSTRKLRTAYSGSAIRVRRSNDNAEQDIGFSGDDLDTSALASFVGANNGLVTTWYDQSGNGVNATQTTLGDQIPLVASGTNYTINSKASLRWTGGSQRLVFTSTQSNPVSVYMVARFNSYVAGAHLLDGSGLNPRMLLGYGGSTDYQMYNGGSPADGGTTDTTTAHSLVAVFNNASSSLSVDDGANVISGSIGTQGRGGTIIGAGYVSTGFDGWIPELVCFNGAISGTDASTCRSSAQSYWGTP
jgi:hypothetical protein